MGWLSVVEHLVRLKYGNSSKTKEAFAQAEHVVSVRLENNRITANSLEPRATIGFYDQSDGTYLLYTSSQNPHGVRTLVARHVLRVPENKVRVVAPDVGGGFGLKSNAHVEDPLVLWASKRCGRPVKWTATRSEALLGDYHARDQVVYGEMAVAADGKILAIRATHCRVSVPIHRRSAQRRSFFRSSSSRTSTTSGRSIFGRAAFSPTPRR